MCRECDPSGDGTGYLLVTAVLLGLAVSIIATWRVVVLLSELPLVSDL